jgi:hypothetical protein
MLQWPWLHNQIQSSLSFFNSFIQIPTHNNAKEINRNNLQQIHHPAELQQVHSDYESLPLTPHSLPYFLSCFFISEHRSVLQTLLASQINNKRHFLISQQQQK